MCPETPMESVFLAALVLFAALAPSGVDGQALDRPAAAAPAG
jgi:hypothetical protein